MLPDVCAKAVLIEDEYYERLINEINPPNFKRQCRIIRKRYGEYFNED